VIIRQALADGRRVGLRKMTANGCSTSLMRSSPQWLPGKRWHVLADGRLTRLLRPSDYQAGAD
jgi:hypothetical protein